MFKTEEIISWVRNAVSFIKARKYYFSVHPSSSHLIKPLNDLKVGKIDHEKDKYLTKYKYFSGTYSTLIQNAKKSGTNNNCRFSLMVNFEQKIKRPKTTTRKVPA